MSHGERWTRRLRAAAPGTSEDMTGVLERFTFMHAADAHLDSPLVGLSARAADLAARVDRASRLAFERLVDLAIEERCRFLVLAGDTFDGDLRDYRTGLFFLAEVARLRDAGVKVYMAAGNHDAANPWFDKLSHADNVLTFEAGRAHTFLDHEFGVAVHGRSFGRRQVTENIAADYPAPHPTYLNVGLLHTAIEGVEGDHARYAPCSLGQLASHGYEYWALGHVHARRVLCERPHVVYPGNLQGRSVRETGPKGATLVHVAAGAVERIEHRDLDDVRWAREEVDLSGAENLDALRARARAALEPLLQTVGERALALRLVLRGETPLHARLARDPAGTRQDFEAMVATLPVTVWLERLDVRTRAPITPSRVDATVTGRLADEVRRLGEGAHATSLVERCLEEVRGRMPPGGRFDELADRVRLDAGAAAVEAALAILTEEGEDAVR